MKKAIIGALGILFVVIITVLTGCTDNERVKMGGSATFNLPAGQKLISCTWKNEADLWYLVRPFEKGEKPTTLEFCQKSSWGTRSGTLYIVESLPETSKDTVKNEEDLSDHLRSTP